MPNLDYTIKKLEEQKRKVNQGDLEVWLNTTHSYIEDQLKSYSTRAQNFQSLISDYRIQKIGDSYGNKIDQSHFRSKAIGYIDECLSYLKDELAEQRKQAKLEQEQKQHIEQTQPMNKRIKTFDEHSNTGAKVFPAPPLDKPKTQLPFGIPPALFWTIFAAFVGASFYLGKEFGQNRFDKEKSDWYEENKSLKRQIQTVQEQSIKQEEHLTKIISEKDQKIISLEKELKEKNK